MKDKISKLLEVVPRALSSKFHIGFLTGLGVYLIALPLTKIYTPSSQMMLIGGNYTNVTSDLGACIAAGLTVHVVRQNKKHHDLIVKHLNDLRKIPDGVHSVDS